MKLVLYHGELIDIICEHLTSKGIDIPLNAAGQYDVEFGPDNYCQELVEFSFEFDGEIFEDVHKQG